jgi:predicted acetyltransferase
MLALVAECKPSKMALQRWMLRITDVAAALEQRGYSGASGELHLDATDSLIAANSGRFVLKVSDGQANVEQGGRGDLKCGVRGLAPLYTGLFRPSVLAQLGWITGTPDSLAAAAKLFGGSEPWMGEYF